MIPPQRLPPLCCFRTGLCWHKTKGISPFSCLLQVFQQLFVLHLFFVVGWSYALRPGWPQRHRGEEEGRVAQCPYSLAHIRKKHNDGERLRIKKEFAPHGEQPVLFMPPFSFVGEPSMEQRKGERQRDGASDNMADAGIGAHYRQPQITKAVERKLFLLPALSSTLWSPS